MTAWLKKQFDFASESIKNWPSWMQDDINNLLDKRESANFEFEKDSFSENEKKDYQNNFEDNDK